MTWQKTLGKESKYFGLVVLISSLFWIALAVIMEQNIIAQEYLYTKERNGFALTVAFLCIIRLSTWMSSKENICEDSNWKTETPLAQRSDPEEPMIVGEAKEIGGMTTDYGGQREEQLNRGSGKAKNRMTVIGGP